MIYSFLKSYLFSKRANAHIKKMSWISLIGIILGTFSLIVVLSVMSGLNKATELRLLMNEPHLVVQGGKIDFKNKHHALSSIEKHNVFEFQDVLIKTTDGIFNGAEAIGIDEDSLKKKKSFYRFDESPLLYDLSDFRGGLGVFIGSDLAFDLQIVVGDFIQLYKPEAIIKGQLDMSSNDLKTVKVLGILNSSGEGREGRLLIYRFNKLFKGKSLSRYEGYEVYAKDPNNLKSLKNYFLSLNLKVETWKERNSALFLALKIEKLTMTFLLGLALLITSFSIMTLLILIVLQKQKDIGILLSMGFSKNRVRLLFGGIGAGVSFFGIFVGGVLGTVVSLLLDLYPLKILPPIYQDPYLPADFSMYTVSWVLFFCIAVAILSSLVPVFYLSKITPVKALKEIS